MVRVSAVMAVRNGAGELAGTLEAIAAQTMPDFELIVVDDGSDDETAQILSAWAARDRRIRVVTAPPEGLTRALIRGCAAATAPVIVREDCGDRSAPERYARQVAVLDRDPGAVLVACAARHAGPGGEELYVVRRDGDDVRRSLLHDDVAHLTGLPGHPTAMFRTDAYRAAGGYRSEFRYAQDVDLWIRLARLGRFVILPEVLVTVTYTMNAISFRKRQQQVALAQVALDLRNEGLTDAERSELLRKAAAISDISSSQRTDRAAPLYFVASCLQRNGDRRWRWYARQALRENLFHFRTWSLFLKP